MKHPLFTATILAALTAGCAGGDPGTAQTDAQARGNGDAASPDGGTVPDYDAGAAARYLPMQVGSRWTYRTRRQSDGGVEERVKERTIEAREYLEGLKSGIPLIRIRTSYPDDVTISWHADQDDVVARHQEQRFRRGTFKPTNLVGWTPYKLDVDVGPGHSQVGQSWDETYEEVGGKTPGTRIDRWTVLAVDAAVTVPAGAFSCLHLRRSEIVNPNTLEKAMKEYWLAPGVGKVKEVGEVTEELMTYSVR